MRQIFSPKPIGAGASSAKLIATPSARRHLAEAVGPARRVALHDLEQHVAADRARRGATGLAVLDDDGAGIARIVDRRVADEQRVVAQMPGQLVLGDAHVALALGDALDLGGAGLASEPELRFDRLVVGVEAQMTGGAA